MLTVIVQVSLLLLHCRRVDFLSKPHNFVIKDSLYIVVGDRNFYILSL